MKVIAGGLILFILLASLLFPEHEAAADPVIPNVNSKKEILEINPEKYTSISNILNIVNLTIDTPVKGAEVKIDNKLVGKTPLKIKIPYANYRIYVWKNGTRSLRYDISKTSLKDNTELMLKLDSRSYEQFLDELLEKGYSIIREKDYYTSQDKKFPTKTIVLRHDVDNDANLALKMAEAEYARGINSTFYFRWVTADPEIIESIRDMGNEVGLHYETLATYAKEHHITNPAEVTPAVKAELRILLKNEITEFERKFGKIYTIASHGAPENSMLNLSNYQAIMEGENPMDYGLIGVAYGPIVKDLSYFSDASGIWSPRLYEAIESGSGPINILTHPIWWTYE